MSSVGHGAKARTKARIRVINIRTISIRTISIRMISIRAAIRTRRRSQRTKVTGKARRRRSTKRAEGQAPRHPRLLPPAATRTDASWGTRLLSIVSSDLVHRRGPRAACVCVCVDVCVCA